MEGKNSARGRAEDELAPTATGKVDQAGGDGEDLADERSGEGGCDRAGGGNASAGEDYQIVGVGEDEVEIVKDGEDGDVFFFGKIAGEGENGVLMREIEARGGFVEKQDACNGR